jgi:cell division protein FtsZ
MFGQGDALMGIGTATGDNRAQEAALKAVENPLLEDTTVVGAQRLLINVSGGESFALTELEEVVKIITEKTDTEAQIIAGAVLDSSLGEKLQVTVIATGFKAKAIQMNAEKPCKEKDFVAIEEWNSFTTRAARAQPFLSHRNYQSEDLDVPTVMRFPLERNAESVVERKENVGL